MLEEIFYRYNQFESGIAPLPESFKFLDLGAAPGGSERRGAVHGFSWFSRLPRLHLGLEI